MRLSVFVGVLAIGGGIALGKMLHDREVALQAQSLPAPSPDATGKPNPGRTPRGRRSSGKLAPLTASEQQVLEEPRRLLKTGRFEDARVAALPTDPNASAGLAVALKVLNERATLYSVLTRGIRRHPFVNAPDLVQVTKASGEVVTARVKTESDETLTLSLADGGEVEIHQENVVKRVRLSADQWIAGERARLEKERSELEDAGALEVFHVAFDAFQMGQNDVGVALLERALALAGGGAVVDVYGAGDLDLLHRAQERLRFDMGNPSSGAAELALARRPHAKPVAADPEEPPASPPLPSSTKRPVPAPVEASPEPDADPEPPPQRASDLERLEHDERWKHAQATYSKAVATYRDSFAGNTAKEKAGIREAAKLLEQTQQLLDQLPQDLGEANGVIDTFVAKVNSLLRDVKKRKMATGS